MDIERARKEKMLNFRCAYCEGEIQAEYAHVGEFVKCPLCEASIAVPDPWLPIGSEYHGFAIGAPLASTMLWNTYKADRPSRTGGPREEALLRIPNAFFLKRVKDFGAFAEVVLKSGTMEIKRIPPLTDYSLTPGKRFFAFEFFDSLDAGDFVSRYGALDIPEALGVARRVAATLRSAWKKRGEVHQNIVPRNVRINGSLKIRLMNFGLSRYLLEDRTLLEQGFNVWDHRYMSPEFATRGKGNTPRCDIYALGGILYLLLTGHPPHDGIPKKELPNAPALDLKYFRSDAPDQLCALVQLMTMRNPATRFEDWDEVVERIDKIAGGKKRLKSAAAHRYMISKPRRDKPTALTTDPALPSQERKRLKINAARRREEMTETIAKPLAANKAIRSAPSPAPGAAAKKTLSGNAGLFTALLLAVLAILAAAVYAVVFQENDAPDSAKTEEQTAPTHSTWKARLDAVDAWFAEHPSNYEGALERYGALRIAAETADESAVAEAAETTIARIKKLKAETAPK